jgi:ribosomal-protein-alanine N-acetyltransferase
MTDDIIIRKALGIDAKGISTCNTLSLPVVYSPREIIQYILNKSYYTTVAILDNVVIGYLLSRKEQSGDKFKGHIISIAILQEYRSKGIGKKILDYSCDKIANKFNVTNITLNVMLSNRRAIKFYTREKFTKFAKLTHYYGKKNHGILMKKELIKNKQIDKINLNEILTDNLEDYF